MFCGEGFVVLAEFATDTDDGCRQELCEHDRGDDGVCLTSDQVSVEPSTGAHPCARQVDSADGLLGICTHGGVRYCYNGGWDLCPGGGGEPCPPTSGPLTFRGRGGLNTVSNVVPLTPGRWRADICLWDSPYGKTSFNVVLWMQRVAPSFVALVNEEGPEHDGPGVAEGRWQVELDISEAVPDRTMWVTAAGGGEWTVGFTRLADADDTG